MNSSLFFGKVSQFTLYALAFLVPLWFLPITQDILGFQKQALLTALVFLGLISWLAKCINDGAVQVRMTWLHVPVLATLLVAGISSLVSLWPYASFWGWPLDMKDNFLTVLALSIFYFLLTQTVKDSSQLFKVFMWSASALAIAGIFGVLQLYQAFLLPFSFAKNAGFNTIGSANTLAMVSAIMLPLSLVLAFSSKVVLRWVFLAISLSFLAVMALINFLSAWLVLAAGLFVLLAFGMWSIRKRTEFGWISFPMALLIVALFFGVFRVSLPGSPAVPAEVSPSQRGEMNIVGQVLKERPFFGSGPGTFVIDYTKYHSPLLNSTIFWGTRFGSGASEVLDSFATKGIFGGLALLSLLGTGLFLGVRKLLSEKSDSASWMLGLGSFASFAGIALSQFLYPSNFVLVFLFWLFLGALSVFVAGEQKRISIAPPSFLAVASSFVFLLVLIFGLGLMFVGGQKYLAEVRYLQGAKAAAMGEQTLAIQKVSAAANLNPSVDIYWRDLAQLFVNEVNRISQDQTLSQEDRKQQAQTAVSNAVQSARQAITRAPANVANWNVQGFVYRNLIAVQGAEEFVTSSYEKAIELDPASPFSWTELGRAYVLKAQSLSAEKDSEAQAEALAKALEKLNKAIELKSDYAPANYLIAVVYDQQGKSDEAVAKLEETKQFAPNDTGLAFQLGVVYWQRQELVKAQAELERAVSLDANYSNARYILGLVYDKQGKKILAKEQFAKILELNPESPQIQQILSNIEKGKPILEGVQQSEPPISENPPEIGE